MDNIVYHHVIVIRKYCKWRNKYHLTIDFCENDNNIHMDDLFKLRKKKSKLVCEDIRDNNGSNVWGFVYESNNCIFSEIKSLISLTGIKKIFKKPIIIDNKYIKTYTNTYKYDNNALQKVLEHIAKNYTCSVDVRVPGIKRSDLKGLNNVSYYINSQSYLIVYSKNDPPNIRDHLCLQTRIETTNMKLSKEYAILNNREIHYVYEINSF